MADPVRVLVADDARMVRQLLERTLAPRYQVVEGASTLAEVDAAFHREPIDVALIDLAWRDEGACLPRLKYWRTLQPSCRIIIVTNYNEWVHCNGCLEHGADGFVVKNDPLSKLDIAIDTVLRGERYISDSVIREPKPQRDTTHRTLSRPARRVLELLAEGFTQKEIALTLQLKLRTVEDHVQAIKRFFGIPTRAKPNWRVYQAGMGGGGEWDVV